MKITWQMLAAGIIICALIGVAYGDEIVDALGWGPGDGDDDEDVEMSAFKYTR